MRLIDADRLLDRLRGNVLVDITHEIEKTIDDQPTIEPKRGEWKGYTRSQYMGMDDLGDPIYRDGTIYICSKCGRRTVIKEKFCPECGADMRGDKHEVN